MAEHLPGQLFERSQVLLECGFARPCRPIQAAGTTFDHHLPGRQQAIGLQPMQCRIQGARTDRIPVLGQLLGHPRAMDFALSRVMKDMQSDRTPLKLPHPNTFSKNPPSRYRRPILARLQARTGSVNASTAPGVAQLITGTAIPAAAQGAAHGTSMAPPFGQYVNSSRGRKLPSYVFRLPFMTKPPAAG